MVVTSAGPALLTVSDIAGELNIPPSQVVYIVRTRRIPPAGRAGNCRLFDEAALAKISRVREAIEARREPVTV